MKTLAARFEALGGKAPIVILDTDFSIDVDDLLDVELCHKLDAAGQIILAATVGNLNIVDWPYQAPALEGMARIHGNSDVLIGALQSGGQTNIDFYGQFIASRINSGRKGSQFDSSTTVYRKVLANAPASSVLIQIVGTMASFKAFYNSAADAISPLTGAQLVAAKVKTILCVAGDYPSGTEYNFVQDPTTADVITNLPANVRVVYSGALTAQNDPDTVKVGRRYATFMPAGYITRLALEWMVMAGRPAWGTWCLLAYLNGYRKEEKVYAALTGPGSNSVNTGTGVNTWDGTTVLKNQAYLTRVMDKEDMAAEVDAILYRPTGRVDWIANMKLDPWVEIYARSLDVNGTKDSPKQRTTLRALNNFVLELRVSGVWTQLTMIAPFCGNNLASAMQLLKYPIYESANPPPVPIVPAMTPVGLTEANFSQELGIACLSVGKYVNTNNTPATLGMSATSHHLGYYSRNHVTNTGATDMGRFDGASNSLGITPSFSGGSPNPLFDTMATSGGGRLDGGAPMAAITRFILGYRSSATVAKLFRDGAQVGSTLTTTAGALPTNSLLIGSGQTTDSAQKRFGVCVAGKALADWQVVHLTRAVDKLEAALGRNV